jgi:hypothetical protein
VSVARVDVVEVRWRPWPGHVTVAKPPRCTVGDCKLPPYRWARCSCGRVFAACGGPHHLHDVPAELEAHRRTCPAPRATDLAGPR